MQLVSTVNLLPYSGENSYSINILNIIVTILKNYSREDFYSNQHLCIFDIIISEYNHEEYRFYIKLKDESIVKVIFREKTNDINQH